MTDDEVREAVENLRKVMQIMCPFPDTVQCAEKRQYSVGFMRGVKMACETLIAAASRPMPEVVTVEEQEIANIISKSFSSKVSAETCEAAAHNLRIFFPNGLIIKGDEK